MKNLHTEAVNRLFQAVLNLKNLDECYNFFEDICTIKEIQDISQRLEVAELLSQNISYLEISKKTGASTATISRVNKCLIYGNDGYKTALERLKEEK